MYCRKCGTENDAGNRMCTNCGFSLQSIENSGNVDQLPVNSQNEPINTGITKPKKKKKIGIGAVIAMLVIICAVVAGYFAYPKAMVAILGDKAYYLHAEKKAMEDDLNGISDIFKSTAMGNKSVQGEITVSLLSEDGLIPEEFSDALEKAVLKVNTQVDSSKKLAKGTFELLYDGEPLGTLLIQVISDKLGFSFPGLGEGQFVTPLSVWSVTQSNTEEEIEKMTGLNKEEFEDFLESYYTDVIADSIPEENISRENEVFDGINCTATVFTIDEDVVRDMVLAFADKLQSEDTQDLVKSILEYYKDKMSELDLENNPLRLSIPSTSEIEEYMNDLAHQLQDEADQISFDEEITYTVYYNSRGNIIARKLEEETTGTDILFANYEKDGSHIMHIYTAVNGTVFDVIHTDKKTGNKSSGTVEFVAGYLDSNGGLKEVGFLDVTYNSETGVKLGNVPVTIGDIEAILTITGNEYDPSSSIIADIGISTKAEDSDTMSFELDATVNSDTEFTFEMSGTFDYSDNPDVAGVSVPDESTLTPEELEGIYTEFFDNLYSVIYG